ncbi:hypothetical protein [uncultured Thiodictyon sp.]
MAELDAYAPRFTPGSCCVVGDILTADMPADVLGDRLMATG